jgi:hypothetical protein
LERRLCMAGRGKDRWEARSEMSLVWPRGNSGVINTRDISRPKVGIYYIYIWVIPVSSKLILTVFTTARFRQKLNRFDSCFCRKLLILILCNA